MHSPWGPVLIWTAPWQATWDFHREASCGCSFYKIIKHRDSIRAYLTLEPVVFSGPLCFPRSREGSRALWNFSDVACFDCICFQVPGRIMWLVSTGHTSGSWLLGRVKENPVSLASAAERWHCQCLQHSGPSKRQWDFQGVPRSQVGNPARVSRDYWHYIAAEALGTSLTEQSWSWRSRPPGSTNTLSGLSVQRTETLKIRGQA